MTSRLLTLAACGACLAIAAHPSSLVAQADVPQPASREPHQTPAPGRVVPAPPPPTGDAPESVTVTPGPQYRASSFRRTFAGRHWRDMWTLPIRVPVIDLARFGGGLTPVEHGGGSQTVSLHMSGADGVEYVLRSVDKAPFVPPEMRGTFLENEIRDETSASHPAAALMAAPLMQAAGLLHVSPALYVIPDDPRLGKFRHEFAGMLAEVEGRPKSNDGEEGFEGASKVVKMDKLLVDINKSQSNRVDSRGYLTARLMDMYLGDWDRGETQWRWARFGDKGDRVWKPIALDRDWAFERSDGIVSAAARISRPELIVFNENYPPLLSLTFREWDQDRRLLQDLDRRTFDSTAHWLQGALTDSVIADAVNRMPPEERAKRGAQIAGWLHSRRDKLPDLAARYYRQLSWGADVRSTADPSVVDVTRRHDTVEVRMRAKDGAPVDAYFDRKFVNGETHDVRLYLDGPDSVTVRGGGDGVKLRIVSGADGTVLVDSTGDDPGKTIVYDGTHRVRVIGAHATDVDGRRWRQPSGQPGELIRDVGHRCQTLPGFRGGSDVGAVLGLTMTCEEFGFRRQPYALSNSVTVGYATASGGGRLSYLGQYRPIGTDHLWYLRADALSARFVRYFGTGNGTVLDNSPGRGEFYYRARESYFELQPGLTMGVAPYTTVSIGPQLRYSQTGHLQRTVFDVLHPYGIGPFGSISALLGAAYDTRDDRGYAQKGVLINISARAVPTLWNVRDDYASVRGIASTYLTSHAIPLAPTLALRIGGEKVWGNAPFQDQAHIGGAGGGEPFSVRGYLPDRFTGDASLFGNAQLEIPLLHPKLVIPTTVGVIALDDIGRVFAFGDHVSTWHNGIGGGVFVAPFESRLVASATLVHGTDGWRFYFGFGTGF